MRLFGNFLKITPSDFQGLTKEMNLGKNIFLAALEIGNS